MLLPCAPATALLTKSASSCTIIWKEIPAGVTMERYFQLKDNGLCVNCKLYTASNSIKRVILFGHGFTGNKDNRTAQMLFDRVSRSDRETALMTLDFPAHGDDASDDLTVERCLQYIDTALDHIRTALKPAEIDGGGVSFGGYLMLRYIAEHGDPFQKLVLRSPAVNMYEVVTQYFMNENDINRCLAGETIHVGSSNIIAVKHAFISSLERSDILAFDYKPFASAIYLVHGVDDEIVDFECVKHFAEANHIQYAALENAGHHFADPEKLDEAIALMAKALYQ